jgi:hypothetical protein
MSVPTVPRDFLRGPDFGFPKDSNQQKDIVVSRPPPIAVISGPGLR